MGPNRTSVVRRKVVGSTTFRAFVAFSGRSAPAPILQYRGMEVRTKSPRSFCSAEAFHLAKAFLNTTLIVITRAVTVRASRYRYATSAGINTRIIEPSYIRKGPRVIWLFGD